MTRPFATQIATRQLPKLRIQKGNQTIERSFITAGKILQQECDGVAVWHCFVGILTIPVLVARLRTRSTEIPELPPRPPSGGALGGTRLAEKSRSRRADVVA
jgi:hypothetical protein